MEAIIGIQIGTKHVRVNAFDLSGRPLGGAVQTITVYHSEPQNHELDAEELWHSVCLCLNECLERTPGMKVLTVCISSVGESSVLVNRKGNPLARVITWYDQRATQQAHVLQRIIGEKELYAITGQFVSPKFGICKLMWMRDNIPEVFTRAYKCLSLHDYIVYKLTGRFVTDYSLASRMMCFDIEKLCWCRDILRTVNIDPSLFPEALPSSSHAGEVTREASGATHLSTGIPVYIGGHDHACAAVAVNIFSDDVILDSMGSAETTMVAIGKRLDIDQGFNNQIAVYPHFGAKLFRGVTSIQAFGAVFDWFAGAFGRTKDAVDVNDLYEWLFQEADTCTNKYGNLMFMPHIRGLQEAAGAKGTFLGIDETCDRSCFVRAMIEGLSYELKRRINACETAFGKSYSSIRAVGEYAASARIMYMKASVVGKQIETMRYAEAVNYGTAVLGSIGAGIIGEDSLQDIFQLNAIYKPEYKQMASYQGKYEYYLKIHDHLMNLY